MLTEFGKEMRKVRLDLGITLNDMALKVGVSPSMLSSCETGKKPAPTSLVDRLAQQYEVIRLNKAKFSALAEATKSDVRIRLSSRDQDANRAALAFARNFDSLTKDQIDQLLAVFAPK